MKMRNGKVTEKKKDPWYQSRTAFGTLTAVVALGAAGVTALLTNISERKIEQRAPAGRVVEVTEDDTDSSKWAQNWPAQYDGYKRTALRTATRFGGHAGSETLPAEKIDRDPWLKRMFLGYAFSIDYRDRRGHAYMLSDQENTERLKKPQSGSCLHCHASIMPLYRELGNGDAMAGFEKTFEYSYQDLSKKLHDSGHAHPVGCVDCHDPKTMMLRVTRPGFINGIQALAESDAEMPAIPSLAIWREGDRKEPYDPNVDASRNEMRSFVCGQCHVEYYCSTKMPLTFPWGKGLKVEETEAFWDEKKFLDGSDFFDYKHKETGAPILKAQHPEYELWSQGVHARAGVACADCHMPYMREGASKVSDHWVRSPLLNVQRACQTCHQASEGEMAARVDQIQQRNYDLLQRGGQAITDLIDAIVKAKAAGASDEKLAAALKLQRKAQWRLDFIAAENSMGFHAPQEAARVLGEAIDYARQGQVAVVTGILPPEAFADSASEDEATEASASAEVADVTKASPKASVAAPAAVIQPAATKTVAPQPASPKPQAP
jgi:nitrite reductase (cytochrome c-552)